jgi:ribosome-associated protein
MVPFDEIVVRASTSGGPGGQHANRTASRIDVSFDIRSSASLGPRQRARLLDRLGPVVRATASEDRSQARNRRVALGRLAVKLERALRVAPVRRPTRPSEPAVRRRLEAKRRQSLRKLDRRPPTDES